MIVANRLTDGRVVFLAEDARWVESIEDGLVIESERAVDSSAVVDPYLIDVVTRDGHRYPSQLRESIRAFGPTVSKPTAR
jgi:hypothetical protein